MDLKPARSDPLPSGFSKRWFSLWFDKITSQGDLTNANTWATLKPIKSESLWKDSGTDGLSQLPAGRGWGWGRGTPPGGHSSVHPRLRTTALNSPPVPGFFLSTTFLLEQRITASGPFPNCPLSLPLCPLFHSFHSDRVARVHERKYGTPSSIYVLHKQQILFLA